MRIAIFGDIHGHWTEFRDTIVQLNRALPLDFVLQVGDAMPVRTEADLAYVTVPAKHRKLGSFAKLKGPWPVPTVFIGGNHEPWNLLDTMPDGGSLLPGLDYLGRVGFRSLGALRIAGISGIYSDREFAKPRKAWPYGPDQAKQASYFRRKDLEAAKRWRKIDILLMHPWPAQLEPERGPDGRRAWVGVGVEPLGDLVHALRPRFVFCGHMHFRQELRDGGTQFVALDAFNERPAESVAVLEGEPGDLELRALPILGSHQISIKPD